MPWVLRFCCPDACQPALTAAIRLRSLRQDDIAVGGDGEGTDYEADEEDGVGQVPPAGLTGGALYAAPGLLPIGTTGGDQAPSPEQGMQLGQAPQLSSFNQAQVGLRCVGVLAVGQCTDGERDMPTGCLGFSMSDASARCSLAGLQLNLCYWQLRTIVTFAGG